MAMLRYKIAEDRAIVFEIVRDEVSGHVPESGRPGLARRYGAPWT
jgi:hypothetical protein